MTNPCTHPDRRITDTHSGWPTDEVIRDLYCPDCKREWVESATFAEMDDERAQADPGFGEWLRQERAS